MTGRLKKDQLKRDAEEQSKQTSMLSGKFQAVQKALMILNVAICKGFWIQSRKDGNLKIVEIKYNEKVNALQSTTCFQRQQENTNK